MKSLFKILIVFLLGIGFSACENAKSGKKPTVITGQAVVNFEAKTVQCNGYVETAGSSAVYDRGICYTSEDKKPTLKDNHVSAGEGLGDFSCTLTKIKEGKYKYCAYATNETGTAYGDTVVFVMSAENGVMVEKMVVKTEEDLAVMVEKMVVVMEGALTIRSLSKVVIS